MEITIRQAVMADLTAILSLYAQTQLDDGAILPIEYARQVFDRIQSYPDYRVYIAISNTQIVGSLALLIMDNLAHLGAPSGIIEDVAVAPNWQRKGIGKQLMYFAMQRCKELGCYKLMLSANMKRDKAHLFYKALGFKRHGYSFSMNL